jgi:hypothetical protein
MRISGQLFDQRLRNSQQEKWTNSFQPNNESTKKTYGQATKVTQLGTRNSITA